MMKRPQLFSPVFLHDILRKLSFFSQHVEHIAQEHPEVQRARDPCEITWRSGGVDFVFRHSDISQLYKNGPYMLKTLPGNMAVADVMSNTSTCSPGTLVRVSRSSYNVAAFSVLHKAIVALRLSQLPFFSTCVRVS